MIDLLINKRTGLPIVAKPAGSAWGYREIDGHNLCVVSACGGPRADRPAERLARLDKRRVAANPFAEYEMDPVTKLPRMVRQSTFKLRPADARRGAMVRMADVETVTEIMMPNA